MLVLPALVAFGLFVFYPLVKTAYLGFFTSPPAPNLPSHYVGLSQYRSVLASSEFRDSLWRTVQFVLYTVPAGIVLGVAARGAHANRRLAGIRIFRAVYSSTIATSTAVAAVIFFTLLNPQVGLFSYWLGNKGGSRRPPELLPGAAGDLGGHDLAEHRPHLHLDERRVAVGARGPPRGRGVDGASCVVPLPRGDDPTAVADDLFRDDRRGGERGSRRSARSTS